MVYEERLVVSRRSAKCEIFPITNSRLSASLVVNCINFLFKNYWFLIRIAEKSLLDQFCVVLDPLQRHFFLANNPYFNFQINFQSSHVTKKATKDASKRLSSYCMGALNLINFHMHFSG